MNTLLGEIATFNDVLYAKYRLAFKLRKLQRSLLLDQVNIKTLQEGVHHSGVESLARSDLVPVSQLISTVQEVYAALRLHKPVLSQAQVKQVQELCAGWMQINYQCATGGKVQAGSLKIVLCLLTGAKTADKARYMFSVLANSNGAVESQDIVYFCNVTQQLAGTLQEDLFSDWAESDTLWRECLVCVRSAEDVADEELDGGIKRQWLSQFEYIKLFTVLPEPMFLNWWSLYHRIPPLEKIVHPVRCAVCTRKPIVAFRYQCTQCSNVNLCQMCFLKGRVTDKHLDSHQMVEISYLSKAQKSWKHRLLGNSTQEGRVWDEKRSPFVYTPRTSVSSGDSSRDQFDYSVNAITDMLVSSQQHHTADRHYDDHTHRPTVIWIGSQDHHQSRSPRKQVTPPTSTGHLKSNSLSTNSSSSPDSLSSNTVGGKFNYEGAGLSRTTSSSSCNDSLSSSVKSESLSGRAKVTMVPLSNMPPKERRVRSQSTTVQLRKTSQQQNNKQDLAAINRRLSMEVDMLLSDISMASAPVTKPIIMPISHTQTTPTNDLHKDNFADELKLEETILEGHVCNLMDKRQQLAGELEGLISKVQNLHSKSLSLSQGIRIPTSPVSHTSPVVALTHYHSDSVPAEAYTEHTHSRKLSSPTHLPSNGLPTHLPSNSAGDLPDPMKDYERPTMLEWHPETHRLSVAW